MPHRLMRPATAGHMRHCLSDAVAQQQRLELLARLAPWAHSVLARGHRAHAAGRLRAWRLL
jgi:hypothetical protein